eukprot:4915316-Pyramimonas_sp.AAC.4
MACALVTLDHGGPTRAALSWPPQQQLSSVNARTASGHTRRGANVFFSGKARMETQRVAHTQ